MGRTEIEAIVGVDEGHLRCELMEIDENLCRAELTPAQRIHYTGRRADIWDALNPRETKEEKKARREAETEVESSVPPQFEGMLGGARPQTKDFAASTSDLTGQSKQAINRDKAIAKAIGDDIVKLTGTSLDSKVELKALASKPEEERAALIESEPGYRRCNFVPSVYP